MSSGLNINFLVAFTGGLVTFFASCLMPLVPAYIAFLAGTGLSQVGKVSKFKIFGHSLAFVAGLLTIFIAFGLTATTLGSLFNFYRPIIQKVGGAALILLGLFMLGIIKPAFLLKEGHLLKVRNSWSKLGLVGAFLFGVTFGFAWTPCIGPTLAAIIFWASQSETALKGTLLLIGYALGIGTPFVIVGLFFDRASILLKKTKRLGFILNKIAGIILAFVGITLLTGNLQLLNLRV